MFSYLHSDLSNNKIEALNKEDMKSLNFLQKLLVHVTRIYTRFMLCYTGRHRSDVQSLSPIYIFLTEKSTSFSHPPLKNCFPFH